jgi:hypothetical protein
MTTTNTPKRKTESGHWYDRHATLVEQVPAKTQKKGEPTKMVDVTLRQARELQLAPGQSTIRQIKDKKQLNNWREQQVLMAALTLPRATGESDEAYIERILEDSSKTAIESARRGSELHATIDAFLATSDWSDPWVAAVGALLTQIAPRDAWTTEQTVVSILGYGTTADAFCRSAFGGHGCVLDFKTKEVKAGKSISDERLWDDHLMQLASTRDALGMPQARTGIVFIDRANPNAAIVWADEPDLQQGWHTFLGLLFTWQAANGYRPDWASPALVPAF